jgi:anti-sigma B factor antagonist
MDLEVIARDDGVSHVRLSGRMDPHGTQKIKERLRSETVGRERSAVVDVRDVSFITSLGVGVIVECADTLQRAGRRFVLVVSPGLVRTVLEKTGVNRIVPMVDTLEEAHREVERK